MSKRQVLNPQCREFVLRLREYFVKERNNGGPLISVDSVCLRVADALGISTRTVNNISKEACISSSVQTKAKNKITRKRIKPIIDKDSFEIDAIRRHIYNYYSDGEYPSLKKLLVSLKSANLFYGQKSSLSKLLNSIGFRFRPANRRNVLLERSDIQEAKIDFLRKMQSVDFNRVVFTDETWINANHTLSRCWNDDTKIPCVAYQ
jgi:ABC-type transport system involved in Fe-S cluster assembly fused permease/ATPase subunit